MQNQIDLGSDKTGAPVYLDVEELLATRLLVQGNSGSGKSHLLRRLLEKSAGIVQQIVIDPEGDFVSLAETFGHVVVDGAAYSDAEIARLAARAREHRASIVLALDNLEIENQMRCAATFLAALFDAPDGASAAGAGGGAGGGGGSLLPQATSAVAHSSAESVALQRRGVEQHFIASP